MRNYDRVIKELKNNHKGMFKRPSPPWWWERVVPLQRGEQNAQRTTIYVIKSLLIHHRVFILVSTHA